MCAAFSWFADGKLSGQSVPATPTPPPLATTDRIVITGDAVDDTPPVEGYRAVTSVTATKTDTPLQDVPQSVQVVTRQVLDAQGDITVTDATRNVSGVVGIQSDRDINNAQFLVRGFPADTYLDGVRQYEPYPTLDSLVNIERVEVLKGPSAVLYTGAVGAPLGGSINLVSKSPLPTAFAEVGLRGGSFNTAEAFIDVNQPLDPADKGRVLFRVTGDAYRADDEVDFVSSERWSIFPTLTLRTEDGRTEFTLRGRYSYRRELDYSGLPITGTVLPAPYAIPRDRFTGTLDQPDTTSSTFQLTGTLTQRLNDVFTFNLLAGYIATNLNQYSGFLYPVTSIAPGSSVFDFATVYLPSDDAEVTVSPSVTAHFHTGPHVEHTVLAGFDYDRTTEREDATFDFGAGTFDVLHPVYPHFTLGNVAPTLLGDNVYETYAGYLQEQATVFDRLHLLGSVRFTQLDVARTQPRSRRQHGTLRPIQGDSARRGRIRPAGRLCSLRRLWRGLPGPSSPWHPGRRQAFREPGVRGRAALDPARPVDGFAGRLPRRPQERRHQRSEQHRRIPSGWSETQPRGRSGRALAGYAKPGSALQLRLHRRRGHPRHDLARRGCPTGYPAPRGPLLGALRRAQRPAERAGLQRRRERGQFARRGLRQHVLHAGLLHRGRPNFLRAWSLVAAGQRGEPDQPPLLRTRRLPRHRGCAQPADLGVCDGGLHLRRTPVAIHPAARRQEVEVSARLRLPG